MFTEALFGSTQNALAVLSRSGFVKEAYLAGGTAAALQLGHRISVDLDFFTPREFNSRETAEALRKLGIFSIEQISWGTIQAHFKEVRFSLFTYKYPVLFPFKEYLGLKILDLRDIATMKIAAISDRSTKRDFIDVYFICSQKKLSLTYILKLYDKKYKKLKTNLLHIYKSLVYFTDAEKEEMPKMLKPVSWQRIKDFFENEVKK